MKWQLLVVIAYNHHYCPQCLHAFTWCLSLFQFPSLSVSLMFLPCWAPIAFSSPVDIPDPDSCFFVASQMSTHCTILSLVCAAGPWKEKRDYLLKQESPRSQNRPVCGRWLFLSANVWPGRLRGDLVGWCTMWFCQGIVKNADTTQYVRAFVCVYNGKAFWCVAGT